MTINGSRTLAAPDTLNDEGDAVDAILAQWRRERPDLDASPMAIFGRIARIFALQRQSQESVLGTIDLPHAAFDVLANLRRSGPPHRKSATRLAESSMISTGGVTFRLDALEAAGLIRRVRDRRDRRLVLAELTRKGFKIIDRAIEIHLAEEHQLIESLTVREREQLAGLLAKLEAGLHARKAHGADGHGREATPKTRKNS